MGSDARMIEVVASSGDYRYVLWFDRYRHPSIADFETTPQKSVAWDESGTGGHATEARVEITLPRPLPSYLDRVYLDFPGFDEGECDGSASELVHKGGGRYEGRWVSSNRFAVRPSWMWLSTKPYGEGVPAVVALP